MCAKNAGETTAASMPPNGSSSLLFANDVRLADFCYTSNSDSPSSVKRDGEGGKGFALWWVKRIHASDDFGLTLLYCSFNTTEATYPNSLFRSTFILRAPSRHTRTDTPEYPSQPSCQRRCQQKLIQYISRSEKEHSPMKFSTTSVMMFLCGQNIAKTVAFSGSRPLAAVSSRAARVLSSAATEEVADSAADEKVAPKPQDIPDMEEIVSLCKRRGIIFPSSEIYNGYAGFFDYGPLGSELKKNLKDAWWKHFVTRREDVVGLDSSIIHNPTVWKSSGTLDTSSSSSSKTEFFSI